MRIVYLEESEEKPVPAKVIEFPPLTVPNLGVIVLNKGVKVP